MYKAFFAAPIIFFSVCLLTCRVSAMEKKRALYPKEERLRIQHLEQNILVIKELLAKKEQEVRLTKKRIQLFMSNNCIDSRQLDKFESREQEIIVNIMLGFSKKKHG